MLIILRQIHRVLIQILNDTSTSKPDLFCSEGKFHSLLTRKDCRVHAMRSDTLIMDPNIYWSIDPLITDYHIHANNSRGLLALEYMELLDRFVVEHGDLSLVQELLDIEKKKRIF